ncbi:MAG: hypothetical protein K8T90_16570 [Planctomycetes bacterium]|nr:hypothetical protein [Planctomycetota bacterium]
MIRSIRDHAPRDRESILLHAEQHPHPSLARALLDVEAEIDTAPGPLTDYAAATRETFLVIQPRAPFVPGRGEATLPVEPAARELALATVRAQVRKVTDFGDILSPTAWYGVVHALEALTRRSPAIRDDPEFVAALAPIQAVMNRELRTCGDPVAGYGGGHGMFSLAASFGDAETARVCLDLLVHWDVAARKLDAGDRGDLSGLSLISMTVIAHGDEASRATLVQWIAVRASPDPAERYKLDVIASGLAREKRLTDPLREQMKLLADAASGRGPR